MEQKLLRMKPMAADLTVSQRTMYDLMAAGMPYLQYRRIIWFDKQKVYDWLSQHEHRKNPANKRPEKKDLQEVSL